MNGFEYCKLLDSSIPSLDGTITTTLFQSGVGGNVNKRVLHIPQSSRAGASPSDVV